MNTKKYRHTQTGKVQAASVSLLVSEVMVCRETLASETRALLSLLAMGDQDVAAGRLKPAMQIIAQLREKRRLD